MNLITILVTAILTENIVLYYFLGLCPFMGTSNKTENAIGMGVSALLVIVLSSLISYFLYYYVLVPYNIEYFKTIVFILVIAILVQIVEILIKRYMPKLYKTMGIYLPLISTNCAVLGIVLMNIERSYTLIEVLTFSVGSSLGFLFIMYIFSTIRERLLVAPIGNNLKGIPIALICAGLIAMIVGMW